jgi:hypothetical protein
VKEFEMEKKCTNCKNSSLGLYEEPCKSCCGEPNTLNSELPSLWEPKPKKKSKWHPYPDEKPKEGRLCLRYGEPGYIRDRYLDGLWISSDDRYTHWRYMPKPPNGTVNER